MEEEEEDEEEEEEGQEQKGKERKAKEEEVEEVKTTQIKKTGTPFAYWLAMMFVDLGFPSNGNLGGSSG